MWAPVNKQESIVYLCRRIIIRLYQPLLATNILLLQSAKSFRRIETIDDLLHALIRQRVWGQQ